MPARRQVALREQRRAQPVVAQIGREMAALDPERHRRVDMHAAARESLLERRTVGDDRVEMLEEARHVAAVPGKGLFEPFLGRHPLEPAQGVGRHIVVVHEERLDGAFRISGLPLADHPGQAPRRRRLDHVGLELVEPAEDRRAVPKEPVILVERQMPGLDPDHLAAARPLLDRILAARREHDQLMPEIGHDPHLAVDIGAHPAAGRRVEFVDVDDTHRRISSRSGRNHRAHADIGREWWSSQPPRGQRSAPFRVSAASARA